MQVVVKNCQTGQRAIFDLPCRFEAFERIGVTEGFNGRVYFEEGPETFGFGLDGYLDVDELVAFLQNCQKLLNPYYWNYVMLSRLKLDCDYFLGYGGRDEGRLWAGNVHEHIAEMKRLWKRIPDDEKPEWLTWEDILQYERKMSEGSE